MSAGMQRKTIGTAQAMSAMLLFTPLAMHASAGSPS
jgi:hypothetical protein